MSNKQTENDFESVFQFLEKFESGVEMRGRDELAEVEQEALKKLALGQLDPGARSTLIPLLIKNEVAMEFLAKVSR